MLSSVLSLTRTRRWTTRLTVLAATVVALYLLLALLDYDPHPARLALLIAVAMAVLWLVGDILGDLGPGWSPHPERAGAEAQHDQRLSTYLRVVEGHLTSSTPDAGLRDRLARLADHRLERRGLKRSDADAAELLGPELAAVLDGPPRRLSVAEIRRHVTRIEEL